MAAFWPRLSKWPEGLGGIGAGRLAPLLLRARPYQPHQGVVGIGRAG